MNTSPGARSGESPGDDAARFRVRRFSDIAVQMLRERILSGRITPGTHVNEVALAEELRISRQPLREALRSLNAEGLVEIIPGRGAYVARFDLKSILQLGDIRLALEGATARLAAERADEEDIGRLTAVLEEIAAELRAGDDRYPRHLDFHAVLARATGNPRLAQAVGDVDTKLQLARARSGNDPTRARQALGEHRVICDAVVRRDPDTAEAAMRTHIQAGMRAIVALISENQPSGGEAP